MLRASAYGLARMHVDGQLAQWGVAARSARRELGASLDALINGMRERNPQKKASTADRAGAAKAG
jgi:hypothetical protein